MTISIIWGFILVGLGLLLMVAISGPNKQARSQEPIYEVYRMVP